MSVRHGLRCAERPHSQCPAVPAAIAAVGGLLQAPATLAEQKAWAWLGICTGSRSVRFTLRSTREQATAGRKLTPRICMGTSDSSGHPHLLGERGFVDAAVGAAKGRGPRAEQAAAVHAAVHAAHGPHRREAAAGDARSVAKPRHRHPACVSRYT